MCRVAYRGAKLTVEWARDGSALEFFKELSDGDQAKVGIKFKYLAEHGKISNREHFHKVEGTGELFEFKAFQIRFLGGYGRDRRFVVAHGLRKKKDRLSASDIKKAERLLEEHLAARQSR